MSKRVLLVINDLRRAGAETQLVYLATGLDRNRFEPRIVILKTENDFEDELLAAGVPVVALGRRSSWDLHVLWRLRRALRAARPDVVHSFLSFANLLTALVAPAAGVRTLILSQRSSYEASLHPFWKRVARWAHRRASHVIVNSEAARREEIAAGFPKGRITCIPNGVPVPAQPPQADRAALGLPAGPLVVCVAQFAPEKGHADLIAAWPRVRAECPGAMLALVGDGPLRNATEAQAARLGVAASILFLGFRHPVAPYLAAADVVVQPSRTEGMPNAVLEAMALGKAIVATAVGGVPELIEDGSCGRLVLPDDAAALAGAIAACLAAPAEARALGSAAARRAAQRFSQPKMLEATAEIYGSVLATAGRKRRRRSDPGASLT